MCQINHVHQYLLLYLYPYEPCHDTVMSFLQNSVNMTVSPVERLAYFDVLLTVHLSIISVIYQHNAQNLVL